MKAVCPRDASHTVKFNGGNVWCLDCDKPAATHASITDLNAARKRRDGLRASEQARKDRDT
jgi:hypothetical protein